MFPRLSQILIPLLVVSLSISTFSFSAGAADVAAPPSTGAQETTTCPPPTPGILDAIWAVPAGIFKVLGGVTNVVGKGIGNAIEPKPGDEFDLGQFSKDALAWVPTFGNIFLWTWLTFLLPKKAMDLRKKGSRKFLDVQYNAYQKTVPFVAGLLGLMTMLNGAVGLTPPPFQAITEVRRSPLGVPGPMLTIHPSGQPAPTSGGSSLPIGSGAVTYTPPVNTH